MSRDSEITKFGDSTEFSPPLKKPKTDPKAEVVEAEAEVVESEAEVVEAEAEVAEAEAEVRPKIPSFRPHDPEDPEYRSQKEIFLREYKESDGFYMDLDRFDYLFAPIKLEWGEKFDDKLGNKELLELLIKTAIDEENEEYGGQLEFVEYVSANVTACAGYCFYITLRAKDLSSPNPEPKLYRAMVHKFCDKIKVVRFNLSPTQE